MSIFELVLTGQQDGSNLLREETFERGILRDKNLRYTSHLGDLNKPNFKLENYICQSLDKRKQLFNFLINKGLLSVDTPHPVSLESATYILK